MKLMQDFMATKEAKDKIKLLTLNANAVNINYIQKNID
jgi:hypothetical protein